MKPPEVHHPVQAPLPSDKDTAETDGQAGPDASIDRSQGLVGDFGPLVDRPAPDRDGAAEEERRAP